MKKKIDWKKKLEKSPKFWKEEAEEHAHKDIVKKENPRVGERKKHHGKKEK